MTMIVWDEPKRHINLAKHGLDFMDLDEEFFLTAAIVPARYGRHMAIGRFLDGTIAVVFFALGTEGIPIVSMRPASQRERSVL
ncbi:MAG: BrnT family toxin [Rhodobacteraceae bacterium]|nr:BrnT family toxin [Paracoccaceae bacterium]